MSACLRRNILPALMVCLSPAMGLAQRQPVGPAPPGLSSMLRHSGYIFSGTVISVQPATPANLNQISAMRVTFRVDQAIRGVRAGQVLAINQWSGLWQAGEGYRAGERVLLFLYPPSRLGLTSPVGGALGKFKLDHNGQVLLNQLKASPLSSAPGLLAPKPPGTTGISARELGRALRRVGKE